MRCCGWCGQPSRVGTCRPNSANGRACMHGSGVRPYVLLWLACEGVVRPTLAAFNEGCSDEQSLEPGGRTVVEDSEVFIGLDVSWSAPLRLDRSSRQELTGTGRLRLRARGSVQRRCNIRRHLLHLDRRLTAGRQESGKYATCKRARACKSIQHLALFLALPCCGAKPRLTSVHTSPDPCGHYLSVTHVQYCRIRLRLRNSKPRGTSITRILLLPMKNAHFYQPNQPMFQTVAALQA